MNLGVLKFWSSFEICLFVSFFYVYLKELIVFAGSFASALVPCFVK